MRRREGWTYHAGPKDVGKKASPYIVVWENLPEKIKDANRRAARAIPNALSAAGFQVYRKTSGQRNRNPDA